MSLSSVIVDLGSYETRVGYSGNDEPSELFPTVISRKKGKLTKVGSDALESTDDWVRKRPFYCGKVQDFADAQSFLDHALEELDWQPSSNPVILTESPFTSSSDRETMAQIMFEKFQIPALLPASTSSLCLIAHGKTTGLVIDIGHTHTVISTVFECMNLPSFSRDLRTGGEAMERQIQKELFQAGLSSDAAREIKHQYAYCSDQDVQETIRIPGGDEVTVQGLNMKPIIDPIQACVSEITSKFTEAPLDSVVLAGGVVKTRNLKSMFPAGKAMENPELTAWYGASALSSMPIFTQLWGTVEEYNETGGTVVNYKRI